MSSQIEAWFSNMAAPEGADIVMGVLPLFHIYAMTTIMNFCIKRGGSMVLQPRFVLEDVLKGIDREKPHMFPGVPTMYMAINNAPDTRQATTCARSRARSAAQRRCRARSRCVSKSSPAAS